MVQNICSNVKSEFAFTGRAAAIVAGAGGAAGLLRRLRCRRSEPVVVRSMAQMKWEGEKHGRGVRSPAGTQSAGRTTFMQGL